MCSGLRARRVERGREIVSAADDGDGDTGCGEPKHAGCRTGRTPRVARRVDPDDRDETPNRRAEERIDRILEAKPVPVGPSGKQGGKAKQAPVDFTEAELAAIAAGEVADKVRVRLEKAAAAGRLKVVDRRTGKPSYAPRGKLAAGAADLTPRPAGTSCG
jgi:hypothetical protein